MTTSASTPARNLVWTAVVVLTLCHQDFWLWDDRDIWGGFLPVGLAYHVVFSVLAAALWAGAVRWAWPSEIEAWADGDGAAQTEEGAK